MYGGNRQFMINLKAYNVDRIKLIACSKRYFDHNRRPCSL